jgi:hypothetical protein
LQRAATQANTAILRALACAAGFDGLGAVMSGRIRTIKPEWLEDELLALASSDARVLSIALILLADDYGNGRGNPVQLAGQVFAGKPLETLAKALEELRAIRFVLLYEVDGQRYFSIRKWDEHQRVDKPGKPRVPGPPADSSRIQPVSETLEKVPETLSNVPDAAANLRASRASDRVVVEVAVGDPDRGPDPGPPRGLVPVRPRAPTNQPDALAMPIAERARLVLEDPANGAWSSPQTWPEVVAVAEALARAAGQKRPRLGDCQRDAGVKIVLGHLADGWPPDELATLAGAIGRSKWWADGGAVRGLSSLTAEVLRRAQNERPRVANMDPDLARELARTRAQRAEIGRT